MVHVLFALQSTAPLPQPSTEPVSAQADPAPSGGLTIPTSVCKVHLFNHIVCVEEELKRRMDYVEEQIEGTAWVILPFALHLTHRGRCFGCLGRLFLKGNLCL